MAKLGATEPDQEFKGGFTDHKVDDLYYDLDFEQATRHFMRDVDV